MKLTEQQKLEILCAYLPHGVGVRRTTTKLETGKPKILSGIRNNKHIHISIANNKDAFWVADIDSYSLILRHPDDMTEEEQATYIELWESDSNFIKCATDCLRYLHSIHIDTFGAIEAEFAIRKETK